MADDTQNRAARTPDAAGCAIFDGGGRVLLVHHTYGHKKWAIPGGQLNSGESPWDAAVRECKEELNIDVELDGLSGVYFLSHRDAYVFVFRVAAIRGTPTPDGVEVDTCRYFSPDKLPSPMSNFTVERIRDAAAFKGDAALREHHIDTYRIGDPY